MLSIVPLQKFSRKARSSVSFIITAPQTLTILFLGLTFAAHARQRRVSRQRVMANEAPASPINKVEFRDSLAEQSTAAQKKSQSLKSWHPTKEKEELIREKAGQRARSEKQKQNPRSPLGLGVPPER
ncbi:hypothetical protein MHYP_G00132020 [Metynnis hypsauchen]